MRLSYGIAFGDSLRQIARVNKKGRTREAVFEEVKGPMVSPHENIYEQVVDSIKGVLVQRLGEPRSADGVMKHEAEACIDQFLRMESLGRLSAQIVHDLNHWLTVMMGYSEKLLFECDERHPHRKEFESMSQAASRAARLVGQILNYGQKSSSQISPIDINTVLGHLDSLLRALIGPHVHLYFLPMPRLKRIRGISGEIEQIIMNLVLNARDALPASGGAITLATANIIQNCPLPHAHGLMPPGSYVRLEVTDTGCGMDNLSLRHLFEPFYTTKKAKKGTGLGLAIVDGIVRRMEGHIVVTSETGKGSSFSIYFPQIPEEAKTAPTPCYA